MEESEKEYNTDYYSPTSPTPTMPWNMVPKIGLYTISL